MTELSPAEPHPKEMRKKIDQLRRERVSWDDVSTMAHMQRGLVPGKCLTAYTKLFSKLELDIHKQQTKLLREKANGKEAIEQRDRASHDLEVVMVQLAEANDALRKDTGEINSLKEQLRQQEEEDDSKGCDTKSGLIPPSAIGDQRESNDPADDSEREGRDNTHEFMFEDEMALDEDLKKVFKATGTTDVDSLVQRLQANQDLHFSLVTRISQTENESESLSCQIEEAKAELRMLERRDNQATKNKKAQEIGVKRQTYLQSRIDYVNEQLDCKLSTWAEIQHAIGQVFQDLDLSLPEEDLLGNEEGVTQANALRHLAEIEKKYAEILSLLHGDDYEEDGSPMIQRTTSLLDGAKANEGKSLAVIAKLALPVLDEDDGERPFSLEELQRSVKDNAL